MQLFRGLTDFVAWWQRINCWPGMFPNPPQNAADGWLLANWSVYWVPPFVDAAFIPADVPDSRIACLTALGGAAAITACVANNQGSWNTFIETQNFIQPFPLLLSFMMSPEVRSFVIDATDGLGDPAIFKLVADGLINLGFTTLHYVGTVENS